MRASKTCNTRTWSGELLQSIQDSNCSVGLTRVKAKILSMTWCRFSCRSNCWIVTTNIRHCRRWTLQVPDCQHAVKRNWPGLCAPYRWKDSDGKGILFRLERWQLRKKGKVSFVPTFWLQFRILTQALAFKWLHWPHQVARVVRCWGACRLLFE